MRPGGHRGIAAEQDHRLGARARGLFDDGGQSRDVAEPDGVGGVGAEHDPRGGHATRSTIARVASRSRRGLALSLEYTKSSGTGVPGRTPLRLPWNWNSGQITRTSPRSLVRRASSTEIRVSWSFSPGRIPTVARGTPGATASARVSMSVVGSL